MFKKCGKIMEKHVGQSSALQEIDRWSSCKFSTAGKHSVRGAELSRLYALGSDVELTLTLVVMSHHQVVC